MLISFATLLLCQLAGEAVVRALGVPVPGPVIGLVLLAILLAVRAPLPSELGDTAGGLLKHLSLLFVPAGVGVVQHLDTFGREGLRLVAVLVISVTITLVVTALVFAGVARLMGSAPPPPGAPAVATEEDEL
jgi:holin-like protein